MSILLLLSIYIKNRKIKIKLNYFLQLILYIIGTGQGNIQTHPP